MDSFQLQIWVIKTLVTFRPGLMTHHPLECNSRNRKLGGICWASNSDISSPKRWYLAPCVGALRFFGGNPHPNMSKHVIIGRKRIDSWAAMASPAPTLRSAHCPLLMTDLATKGPIGFINSSGPLEVGIGKGSFWSISQPCLMSRVLPNLILGGESPKCSSQNDVLGKGCGYTI